MNLLILQDYADDIALNLVRWTILVDTVNLSPDAKKVTPEDVEILEKIETILKKTPSDRYGT